MRYEVSQQKCGFTGAAHGVDVFAIKFEDGAVFAEGVRVIIDPYQALGDASVRGWVRRKAGRRCDQFGLCLSFSL